MTENLPILPTKDEMNIYLTIAKTAANTPYWNKLGGEAGVLSIMLLARELGISPMNAISGMFHVVQGKVELSAKGITYLIRRHGHKLKLVLHSSTACTIKGIRSDTQEEMDVTYTLDDAQKAGLLAKGGGWKTNPKDMLWARAVSRLGRWLFTDCLGTCYVEGELIETIEKGAPPVPEIPHIEEEKPHIKLPEDISQELLDEYLSYLAESFQKAPSVVLKAAEQRPDAFFESIRNYEKKKKVTSETEEESPETEESDQS